MEKPITQALLRRRSVRSFLEQPVSREILTALVEAACAAPSASNRRPWEYVAVTGPEGLAGLRGLHPYSGYNAPAALVVCGDMRRAYAGALREFWVQDCSAAIQSILLAALDYGLGACWIGVYPDAQRAQRLQALLALPPEVIPLGAVYVGYPAETPAPRTQFEAGLLHWERF